MIDKVFINTRFVPLSKAYISIFDRGLNYGDGLFETMKAYKGEVFLFKEHIERLKNGAKLLAIPLPDIDFKGVMRRLLELNGLSSGQSYIKLILTRGVDRAGHGAAKGISPTVIITAKAMDVEKIKTLQKNGIKAIIIPPFRGTRPKGGAGLKSLNYLPNVMGKIEAEKRGAFEALFSTMGGKITEGTSTNIFIVKNKIIKTPPLSDNILAGITRMAVIKLASLRKIKVKETSIRIKEFFDCDEAFVTNSIIEIAPLIMVDGFFLGNGRPGNITRVLQEYFAGFKKTWRLPDDDPVMPPSH